MKAGQGKMAHHYAKNYYRVLGLEKRAAADVDVSQAVLRQAYRTALLRAHPDKAGGVRGVVGERRDGDEEDDEQHGEKKRGEGRGGDDDDDDDGSDAYTVDDIKEALAVLSDAERRAELDAWLERGGRGGDEGVWVFFGGEGEFLAGLEVCDLSEFEVRVPFVVLGSGPGSAEDGGEEDSPGADGNVGEEGGGGGGGGHGDVDVDVDAGEDTRDDCGGGEMEWTRACRCGAEKGFRITEGELERAEGRGEKEVLVGCEGCSLWVRVGFDVEEG